MSTSTDETAEDPPAGDRTVLAITASSGPCDCALRSGLRTIALDDDARARKSASLAGHVDALFRTAGLDVARLDEILLDVGPGSYTGLRIAVTFARMAAGFRGVRLSTCTSLELFAHAARVGTAPNAARIRPVLDARRARFHTAAIDDAGTLVEAPRAVDRDTLVASIETGDLVLAARPLHEWLGPAAESRGASISEPEALRATALFDAGIHWHVADAESVEPLYLISTYAD